MTTHLKYDNFNIDLLVMEQKKNLYIKALVSHIFPDYAKVSDLYYFNVPKI